VIGIVGGFAISIRSMGIVICLALVFDGLQRWWQVRKGIRTESLIAAVKHPILVAVSALGFYLLISSVLFSVPGAATPYPNISTWDSLMETFVLNVEYYCLVVANFLTPRNAGFMPY
jgi:hypothetical protein